MSKTLAVAMFSGGLDSCLAAHIIKSQGVEVIAVNFQTHFNTPRKSGPGPDVAARMAEQLGVELFKMRLGDDYLEMLRSPRYGYGRGLNPCIDCRIFLIKKAAEVMKERDANFIITGEVLGQRPMSQRRGTMEMIEEKSGYAGLILRPLSARLFPPTIPEEKGWVDREGLLDISGRSRAVQMELAEKYGIKDYPSPAGGCLLTEPEYTRKLKDLFRHLEKIPDRDIELLKAGRHFRLSDRAKIVVGRNDPDNKRILELAGEDDIIVESEGVPGPTTLVTGNPDQDEILLAAGMTARYISKRPEGKLRFKIMRGPDGVLVDTMEAQPLDPQKVEKFRI